MVPPSPPVDVYLWIEGYRPGYKIHPANDLTEYVERITVYNRDVQKYHIQSAIRNNIYLNSNKKHHIQSANRNSISKLEPKTPYKICNQKYHIQSATRNSISNLQQEKIYPNFY